MVGIRQIAGLPTYYEADGPLSHRDVAVLRRHHWLSLRVGPCRLRWQGSHFLMFGKDHDLRVPYDGPAALNAAWEGYKKGRE